MNYQIAAGITNPALGGSLQGQTGISFFQKVVPNAIGLAFLIGSLIFFFIMIVGAIGWISSGGDKAAIETARSRITSAIVGLVVLLSLFALLKIIETFFGVNILTLDIGPLQIQ
jgi:hypothetical protein